MVFQREKGHHQKILSEIEGKRVKIEEAAYGMALLWTSPTKPIITGERIQIEENTSSQKYLQKI